MTTKNRSRSRLITFPPSVDSETARWILGHHGIDFREERHSPLIVACMTPFYGKIPVFLGTGVKLSTGKDIADYFEQHCPADRKLVPGGNRAAAEVREAFREYNQVMGVTAAQWVYSYVFQLRDLAVRLMTLGVPQYEKPLTRFAYPLIIAAMKLGLERLNADVARKALDANKRILDSVDAKLADGRRFLVDDRLTLADISFCACAAPLLLDDQYGGPLPTIEQVQPEMQKEVEQLRRRPAARFANRMYREFRHTDAADSSQGGTSVLRAALD